MLRRRGAGLLLCVGVAALLVAGLCGEAALAQGNPFGAPRTAPPPPDGIVGWLLAKQSEFYRGLSGAIRAAKADGSAVWTLFALSFAYGVFHAAGPGHGKAVISSYVVANGETWRRGVALSFASALLQALVAVALVGIAAALLGATRRAMDGTVWWIEVVSYGLIALVGARLLWVKGLALIKAWQKYRAPVAAPHHHHDHHHHHDDHACGHAHAPEPQDLGGPGGWKRGLSAIVAVGLRPCSGAVLVLVFALAQGLFWAGVIATFIMGLGTAITVAAIATLAVGARGLAQQWAAARPGPGMLALRGIEVGAAVLVLMFGVALLTGYIASERMFGA